MNIYQKLMAARLEFHSQEIKKSGWNSFSKYHYFELGDFVVPLLKIFNTHGILSLTSFTADLATLTLVNTDKPEETIVFTSPMAKAELKAAHEIQQLGAVETYQRRYLYVAALDIVEHDAIDSAPPREEKSRDWATEINAAKDLKKLQAVFKDAYKATSGDEQRGIKTLYDMRKLDFLPPEDKPAAE